VRVFCVVVCGEFVVECVANVVIKLPDFAARKIRQVLRDLFSFFLASWAIICNTLPRTV
jgi:hypothetical protein